MPLPGLQTRAANLRICTCFYGEQQVRETAGALGERSGRMGPFIRHGGGEGFVFAEERKNKTHCEHPVKKSYLFDTEYLP